MTVRLSTQQIKEFQLRILDWYFVHKRDFPWRHTRDPYKILISEVMSQQTQMSRVVPKYEAWMEVFPTIESLANAPVREVLKHWSGLGYNRRALYLKKCAEELIKRKIPSPAGGHPSSGGEQPGFPLLVALPAGRQGEGRGEVFWPQTEKELMQLPGIGKYTARAILCFAFNKQVAVVDTNVRKVILTKFVPVLSLRGVHSLDSGRRGNLMKDLRNKIKIQDSREIASPTFAMTDKEIEEIAEQILPKGKAYEWNQALMDYASAVLKNDPSTPLRTKKQTPFKDSDRFVRGQIIKLLLSFHALSTKQLHDTLSEQMDVGKPRLLTIIANLIKEGMIQKKEGMLTLP